jgi:GT2 family glycosyltransferase
VCLQALATQTYPADAIEILVVDNGSSDEPGAVARRWPRVRLLSEPRISSFAARNRGIEASTGHVLAFTDADCSPHPSWLEKGIECLQRVPDCGLVGGRIDHVAPTATVRLPELYDRTFNMRQAFYVERLHFAATANMFTTRTVVDAVGGFHSELRSGGDVEWGQRVHARGYAVVYCAEACVFHTVRRSWQDLLRRERRVAGGAVGVLRVRRGPVRRRDLFVRELGHVLPGQLTVAWASPVPRRVADRIALSALAVVTCVVRLREAIRVRGGATARRA